MGKNYSRVQRGQVYWFDPIKSYGGYNTFIGQNNKEYQSSVQINNRPWLVVSNNEGNSSSPTCNIVPITLESKADIPVHVEFLYEGKRQTILVEQIRTVDCLALNNYIYTVSDELMEKVEKAMAIQFNIRPSISALDFTLDSTVRNLEKIVSNIIVTKVEAIKQELQSQNSIPVSQIEDTAIKLGQMIEDLVGDINPNTPTKEVSVGNEIGSSTNETVKPIKKNYSGMSAVDKFNARYGIATKEPAKDTTKSIKETTNETIKRNRWTTEAKLQYLKECEEMSPREVQEKYGFKTLQSVFQVKYQHKTALIKAGVLKPEK